MNEIKSKLSHFCQILLYFTYVLTGHFLKNGPIKIYSSQEKMNLHFRHFVLKFKLKCLRVVLWKFCNL